MALIIPLAAAAGEGAFAEQLVSAVLFLGCDAPFAWLWWRRDAYSTAWAKYSAVALAAAGEVTLHLPDGDYEAEIATSAGATAVTLPRAGEQTIEMRVTAGSVEMRLPPGMEARVEVDQAIGNFDNERADLERVGDGNVWQTPGYEENADRVTVLIDVAVGSVTLR